MPQKDDFLTRVQAQLAATLERARQLGAEGRTAEALSTLHEAQRNLAGLDSDLLHRLGSADLLLLLGPAGVPDIEKCLNCAELLMAELEVRAAHGEADPAQAQKALELYLNAVSAEPDFAPHYGVQLRTLTHYLGYGIPVAALPLLVEAYTHAGDFDEAENWLYRWRELEPGAAGAKAEAFYRALLTLSDEVLVAGGLPRAEVEEGLADVTRETTA
jgi:tetratricopeptide (TPR) repeat protein